MDHERAPETVRGSLDHSQQRTGSAGIGDQRAASAELAKYFAFLDDLREGGSTNMFGAAPYLQGRFGMEKAEARAVLKLWMDSDLSKTPAERAAIARAEGR